MPTETADDPLALKLHTSKFNQLHNMKTPLAILSVALASIFWVSCDSEQEEAREDALENKADALEDQADIVRDQK